MHKETSLSFTSAVKAFLMLVLSAPLVSRMFGWLVARKHPRWLVKIAIARFIRMYGIDTTELEKPLDEYPSLSAFFIRKLKQDARPCVSAEESIVSPVDALIMTEGELGPSMEPLQIKGKSYPLKKLVPESMDLTPFQGGRYIQLYLSPKDYHRIHFPFDATVTQASYCKGRLLPVNPFSLSQFKNVFCENERIILTLRQAGRDSIMALVGALNVGRIGLSFSDFETNRPRTKEGIIPIDSGNGRKGDELGWFMMGSTVVMFFPRDTMQNHVNQGDTVRVGQVIGRWT